MKLQVGGESAEMRISSTSPYQKQSEARHASRDVPRNVWRQRGGKPEIARREPFEIVGERSGRLRRKASKRDSKHCQACTSRNQFTLTFHFSIIGETVESSSGHDRLITMRSKREPTLESLKKADKLIISFKIYRYSTIGVSSFYDESFLSELGNGY
jgi:hypothetical protein